MSLWHRHWPISTGCFCPAPGDGFTTFYASDQFANNDWTVTSGSIDWIGTYWQAPPTGGYSVDLDGNTPGAISNTINLLPGVYTLNFFLAGNPDGAPTIKTVQVTAGSTTQSFTFNDTGATETNMNWVPASMNFTVTGVGETATPITFASADTGSGLLAFGPVVGGVSVPEASFYADALAFALGLAALLKFGRKLIALA